MDWQIVDPGLNNWYNIQRGDLDWRPALRNQWEKIVARWARASTALGKRICLQITKASFLTRGSSYYQTELGQKFWITFMRPTKDQKTNVTLFKFCLKKKRVRKDSFSWACLTIHSSQLVATVDKTDETGTVFFKKCLILPLTFLRLTDFKPSRGNLL